MQVMEQSEAKLESLTPQSNGPLPNHGPRTLQETAVVFFSVGILVCFFAPWIGAVYGNPPFSGATLYKLNSSAMILWTVPMLAIAVLATRRNRKRCSQIGTVASVVTVIYVAYFLGTAPVLSPSGSNWGALLTIWFCLGLYACSGEQRMTTPIDFVAKKLGSRKAEVFSHWGTLTPGCHFSAQEFYAEVEESIFAKQWPGVQLLRLEYREAGLLSHKREYLRIVRQRQLFDVCASTFGKDYFFTVREAQIPVVIDGRTVFCALAFLGLLFAITLSFLGLLLGAFAWLFILTFGVWFLFNVMKLGLTKLDSMLIQLPVLGTFYEAWFRRDTYFQQDSRLIFLQCVNELVKEHVEKTTSAKGLKYLNCFENQPLLDGLYKRKRVNLDQVGARSVVA